ncbi:hypothetical protein G9A89_020841 [Geosiphon pyriformis]|nr:hypothetical protein G9A89_020841 [Geosiphon pyriformis]
MDSKENSVSKVSDVKNMKNMVAKKTSYIDSNTSKTNDMVDNATPRMMHTKTYILGKLLKELSFDILNNDGTELVLLAPKFIGSNRLLLADSHVGDVWNFDSKKSFALDVDLFAVPDKTLVNNEVRKINKHLDREVIIKKIPVDLSKSAVVSVFFRFDKIVSVRIQLIGLWQKVWVEFESLDVASMVAAKWLVFMGKDSLLAFYGGRTCFIGHNPVSYACNRCAVVCFNSKELRNNAITGLFLACCAKCDQFGHVFDDCFMGENSDAHRKRVVTFHDQVRLTMFFGGKTWAQVASSSPACSFFLSSLNVGVVLGTNTSHITSAPFDVSGFNDYLASLEHSLELVVDQVSDILKKLGSVNPVPLPSVSHVSPLVVSNSLTLDFVSDMVLDGVLAPLVFPLLKVDIVFFDFSPSSSKVLTTKVCGLESKMVALEVLIHLVLAKLDLLGSGLGIKVPAKQEDVIFTSGLEKGYLGASVAVIMNNFLACYVSKVEKIPDKIILV